jgi:hypothetical protein
MIVRMCGSLSRHLLLDQLNKAKQMALKCYVPKAVTALKIRCKLDSSGSG